MAFILPGYTHVDLGLDGKPFEYTHNPKGLLHSTEGTSLAGAEQAMRNYPSHLGYDYRTRDKRQYISLDRAAYSAMDESDNDPIYQVELVGFAATMRDLPDWALRNIAEDVIRPLQDAVGIPDIVIPSGFKDGRDGIVPYISTPQSPIRISYAQLRAFSGWLGHQHLPSPDSHWDPGAINIWRLLEIAGEDDMALSDQQDQRLIYLERLTEELHATIVSGAKRDSRLNQDLGFVLGEILTQLGQPGPVVITPESAALIAQALQGIVPSAQDNAQATVAELKKEGN